MRFSALTELVRHSSEDFIQHLRQTREQFEQEMQADQERQARHDAKSGWHTP